MLPESATDGTAIPELLDWMASRTLLRFGHEVVVFERGARACGIWAAYPAADYAGGFDEYERARSAGPRRVSPLAT